MDTYYTYICRFCMSQNFVCHKISLGGNLWVDWHKPLKVSVHRKRCQNKKVQESLESLGLTIK